MAFVSTGPTLSGETLFISSGTSDNDIPFGFGLGGGRREGGGGPKNDNGGAAGGLGRVENGERVVPIGSFDGHLEGKLAELTGTGDGRLFGFFATRPATLAEINPKTAAILSERRLPQITSASAWAHAFWGGRFYLFWSRAGEGSTVSRVDIDGHLETLGRSPRLTIVGAGVSTCAPTSLE
jgi:hypothetical protein